MAWLEAHQELRDHPKTKRAARILGITRPQMIGHLLCLWWWCLDYAQDGSLSDFDNADIADAAEWEGEPDDFIDALLNCGPADRAGFLVNDNGLHVKDWEEYGGKYITKRNQSRDRQRTYRQRNANETLHNAEVTRYTSVSNDAREEERREENRTEEEPATAARSQMARQYEAVLGMVPTASYPEMTRYMDRLINASAADWWTLALQETTGARRPGWQYMKSVLEAWLAAGQPSTSKVNGHSQDADNRPRVKGLSQEELAATDARQAEYERQIAEQLARAGRLA
jgi:hypothetical protein